MPACTLLHNPQGSHPSIPRPSLMGQVAVLGLEAFSRDSGVLFLLIPYEAPQTRHHSLQLRRAPPSRSITNCPVKFPHCPLIIKPIIETLVQHQALRPTLAL